ncbi:hypothetical protein B0H13DRAFT_1861662 [Mycena leptocephala]|nr:hypothetical protein B0H13DRAFT_1861662 [Mycena leptocephala]
MRGWKEIPGKVYKASFHLCSPSHPEWRLVTMVMPSATRLKALTIRSGGILRSNFPAHPPFLTIFSLSALQCIELCNYTFMDALELEALLIRSAGLKTLYLTAVNFHHDRPVTPPGPATRPLALQSLALDTIYYTTIHSMLKHFTKIDIRDLQSLWLSFTPIGSLLKQNATWLRALKISDLCERVEPHILACNSLQFLSLELDHPWKLLNALRPLGNFANLTMLQSITIRIANSITLNPQFTDSSVLQDLDYLFGVAGDVLEEVNVYTCFSQSTSKIQSYEEKIVKQNAVAKKNSARGGLRNLSAKVPKDVDVEEVKKERDNGFNTAKLKDAARLPTSKQHGGYIRDPETDGKLLRPDWTASFTDNSSWHIKMIKYIRQKIPTHNPAIAIDEKSDDDILERLDTVFRNIVQEYRRAKKVGALTNDAENQHAGEEGPDADDDSAKRVNRRKGRKVRKQVSEGEEADNEGDAID